MSVFCNNFVSSLLGNDVTLVLQDCLDFKRERLSCIKVYDSFPLSPVVSTSTKGLAQLAVILSLFSCEKKEAPEE